MSLEQYQKKRDFSRTPEPAGAETPQSGPPRFVVQRHRARRLHYDFRLEVDGVLASWAVPKGVTLDPAARHLAVHVEDHPMDYELFEGVIPGGEYGSGDVIVWDRGTWELHGGEDAAAAIASGELHAELFGEKLRGRVVLVRTKRDRDRSGKDNWLLLHKRDEHAIEGWDPEEHPRSVLSGRTNDEVAANPDRLWTRDAGEQPAHPERPELAAASEAELAALDALGGKGRWTVQGRELALTNLDKELFGARDGDPPVTKRDLVRYYAAIAPTLLPYLDRHTALDHLDVRGFPKVTGQRGIQIWIPIEPGPRFSETRAWVEQLSRAIGDTAPDLVSWTWKKGGREGRARLDYTQNAINKTLVAPYSPRAAPGAPVSIPITWDELDDSTLQPDRWTLRTVLDRVGSHGDPMAPALTETQHLPPFA